MSSAEEDINDAETSASRIAKKRRVQRACDVCRRKKSNVFLSFGESRSADLSASPVYDCSSFDVPSFLTVPNRRWKPDAGKQVFQLFCLQL
jgi:hypothetical protein